jgi:DNA-binding transcriptional LysR family regulator
VGIRADLRAFVRKAGERTSRLCTRFHPSSISTNDADAHLRMVEAGLGVSILPAFLVEEGLRRRRLSDVFAGERFEFPILLVTRKGHALSRGAQALLDEVVARVS